jgi:hypothetical protein
MGYVPTSRPPYVLLLNSASGTTEGMVTLDRRD